MVLILVCKVADRKTRKLVYKLADCKTQKLRNNEWNALNGIATVFGIELQSVRAKPKHAFCDSESTDYGESPHEYQQLP